MVVYVLHGFRWYRAARGRIPGIRGYIILENVEDAAAEYLQNPTTNRVIIESFKRTNPDILSHLPDLQLIEQHDPEDISPGAVSQPYAFVAAKVHVFGDSTQPGGPLSLDLDNIVHEGPGLSESGLEALSKLRDTLAPEEKIGWSIVYNGDPERRYPGMDEESNEGGDDVELAEDNNKGTENPPEPPAVCSHV